MGHIDEKALLDAKKAPWRELRLRFGKAGVDAVLSIFQVVNEGVADGFHIEQILQVNLHNLPLAG